MAAGDPDAATFLENVEQRVFVPTSRALLIINIRVAYLSSFPQTGPITVIVKAITNIKTRKNAIVEYLDYQIPVTQLSEIEMRPLPAVDRLKRCGR